jgi:hypothetical protein
MKALFLKLWSAAQGYVIGGLIAIAVALFFLCIFAFGAKARAERRATLAEDNVAKLSEELMRSDAALLAAESRSNERQGAREELRDDEARILQNPVTRDCVASPAIRDALGVLSNRRSGDTSERDSPE